MNKITTRTDQLDLPDQPNRPNPITVPSGWIACKLSFEGEIDTHMNIMLSSLGHRIHIKEGNPNVIMIHRAQDEGKAFFAEYLQMIAREYEGATIEFTFHEKLSREITDEIDWAIPQIISDGWDRLRQVFRNSG